MSDLAPDYAEPITGWRVWVVVDVAGRARLRSVVQRTLWPVRAALVAECRRRHVLGTLLRRPGHDSAPDPACRCGIYATHLEELERLLGEAAWEAETRVLGQVSLWGEVIECERGWRASHAYPSALYVPLRDGRHPRLAQAEVVYGLLDYGVPVEALPRAPGEAVATLAREAFSRRSRSSAA